jgi:tol-pal system protein YbgF
MSGSATRRARAMGLVAALLAVTGCASRELSPDAAALRAEMQELRRLHDLSTRELAKLVGELKDLDSQLTRLAQGERGAGQTVARLDARVRETEETVRGLRSSLESLSGELSRLAPASAPPAERPVDRERVSRGPAEQGYAAALASFRSRDYAQAVAEFGDFLARHPQHPLAANAQFWLAEAYYQQGDYGTALSEYRRVVEQNAKSVKAPDALLKIGLCLRALNEPERAQEAWQELVQIYPNSSAARQARLLIQAPGSPRRAR